MCWKRPVAWTDGKLDYTQWSSSNHQTNCLRLYLAAVINEWHLNIFSVFKRWTCFLSRTALHPFFMPFNFPLSKPHRENTHLLLMVRNFLGQWKDKMLLLGPAAALRRSGDTLSLAYDWTETQEERTIYMWSHVMSVARIQKQMCEANPRNHYPSLSWDHQGKCQGFLETRAGTARPQAEPHGAGGRSHVLGHLQLLLSLLWHGLLPSQAFGEGTPRKRRPFPSKE